MPIVQARAAGSAVMQRIVAFRRMTCQLCAFGSAAQSTPHLTFYSAVARSVLPPVIAG